MNESETDRPMTENKRTVIARRAAQEIDDGCYVSLGQGIPALVARYIPEDINAVLLSENGLLGVGPQTKEDEGDADLVNAGKETVRALAGTSFFSSAEAYVMIRGGHLDLCILGGLQVDEHGNLANWMIPGKMIRSVGSAMDLACGARRVVVAMEHSTREKKPKLLRNCNLPLTGLAVVHRIITELAVIDVTDHGFLLREVAPGRSVDEVIKATEASLKVDKDLKIMQL